MFPIFDMRCKKLSVYADRKHYWDGDGPIPYERFDELVSPKLWMGKCRWLLYLAVYGPDVIREAHIKFIKDEFYKIPGAKIWFPEDSPSFSYLRSRVKIYTGTPDLRELDWTMWLPNGTHTAFSPISPTTGEDAMKQYNLTKRLHQKYGFDYFPTFCAGWREMHHITTIIYDRGSQDSKDRAVAMLRELIAEGLNLGFGEYRTHLALMDQVMGTYNYNNSALLRFNEKLKDSLDPNSILSPGRNGIWGQRFRGKGLELPQVVGNHHLKL